MSNDFDRLAHELDVANALHRHARTDADRQAAVQRREDVMARSRAAVDDIVLETRLPCLLEAATTATKDACNQWPDFWYGPDPAARDEDGRAR